jgi:hypothetical protein
LLIPTVQQALCDDSAAVRSAAGAAFNQMFRGSGGGADASSEILPALLASLDGDLNALEGLKQVRVMRFHAWCRSALTCGFCCQVLKAQPKLLSSVLPRIATPPLTAFSAQTLGALAEVSGAALPPHLPLIMPPLLSACSSEVRRCARMRAPMPCFNTAFCRTPGLRRRHGQPPKLFSRLWTSPA